MNANFIFVRHSQGCHNAKRSLSKTTDFDKKMLGAYLNDTDPTLTELGVGASIKNGQIVENLAYNIHNLAPKIPPINSIDIIGCSPMLRSMETAYYMSRKWKKPPKKIVVFPYLRELDETATDPYTQYSKRILDTTPSYALKSIEEQKAYLESIGILDYFDFSVIEKDQFARKEPGNIKRFVKWFSESIETNVNNINVFVVTHAGVLYEFSNEGYVNNSGFILNATLLGKNVIFNNFVSLTNYLPDSFFKGYNDSKYNLDYYCPSKRCGNLCKLSTNTKLKEL